MYLGMILTGILSGLMFETFCKEDNTDDCYKMWIVTAGYTILAPFMLLVLRPLIEKKESHTALDTNSERS